MLYDAWMNTQGPVWDEWKKALVTLPDTAFFALIRHYLGPVQTPFNKQTLVGELVARLTAEPCATNRRLLLNETDADILAALLYLGPTSAEAVAEFLGEASATLPLRLVNLEERLWVYRHVDAGKVTYQASPLTTDEQITARLTPTRFFSGYPQAITENPPLFDQTVFLALYAAVVEFPLEKSQTGEWKKRTRRDFVERFSGLPGGEAVLDLFLGAAEKLGLVVWEDQHLRLVESYWDDLGNLAPDDIQALLACSFGPWKGAQLNAAAKSFWEFSALTQPSTAYTWAVLRRLAGRIASWKSVNDREKLLKGWLQVGYLIPGSRPETWLFQAQSREKPTPCPVVLEANFEWRLSLGAPWSKVLTIVRGSRLVRWDRHPHFELTKVALQRGVSHGLGASQLAAVLGELTGRVLPQNVRVSLSEWEREARSLRLLRGLVLQVDPAKIALLAHAPQFQEAILETLAPGVYLIDPEALEAVTHDLARLGFPPLPMIQEARKEAGDGHPWSFTRWSAPRNFATAEPVTSLMSAPASVEQAESLMRTWREQIEVSDHTSEEKEELLGRLRRRLFVEDAQLGFPVVRGERLEAKGLDYVGKLRLIEQALASAYDTLEIIARDATGQPVSITVRPTKLERQGTEMLLRAEDVDSSASFQGFVSRMAMVRRIRGSLFW